MSAGYNIGTITAVPCANDPTLGHVTLALEDALEPATARANNVVPARELISDRDPTRFAEFRRAISALPDVVEVTDVDVDLGSPPVPATVAERSPNTGGGDTGLLYLVHEFASAPTWRLASAFDGLPLDPYIEGIGAGRFRAYSKYAYFFPGANARAEADAARATVKESDAAFYNPDAEDGVDSNGVLVEVPDPAFNPPSGYTFEGREDGQTEVTKDRRFVRVPAAIHRRPEFAEMIARFTSYARLDQRYASRSSLTVGVHVIRIKADASDPGLRGQVVPEGMHQDGFEYIGLISPSRVNVAGDWQTYVYVGGANGERPSPTTRPIFQNPVEPGCMLFLDDRRMWHDADDLRQEDPAKGPGWRDFVVITLAAEDNGGEARNGS